MHDSHRECGGDGVASTAARKLIGAVIAVAAGLYWALPQANAQVPVSPPPGSQAPASPFGGVLPPPTNQADATAPAEGGVPAFQLFGAIDLAETYTTNAGGEVGIGLSAPDEYTRGMLQLGVRYNSRRGQLFANYSLIGDYYARFHSLNEYLNYLNLAGQAQLIPDHLTLNVTSFAAPTLLNRTGAISAGGELVGSRNNSNTYGYLLQPQYVMRFRDWAISTTTLSQGAVYFQTPVAVGAGPVVTPIENATSLDLAQRIYSGDYFGRLMWSLNAVYDKLKQSAFSETQKNYTVDLGYAVDRTFALLATLGYNDFKATVPLSTKLSGPEALGGFRYTPNPAFSLSAEGGIRNHSPTYIGSLHWGINPFTSVDGSLIDAITTPQGGIIGGLSGFGSTLLTPGFGVGGVTLNPILGAAPQLGTISPIYSQGLAIDNSIYHDRQANVTLSRTMERMNYSLSFFADSRKQVTAIPSADPQASLYGIGATVSRQLSAQLTGTVSGTYSAATEFGGNDEIFTATAGLQWAVSDTFGLYLLNRYLQRNLSNISGTSNAPLSDEEVVIGLRRSF